MDLSIDHFPEDTLAVVGRQRARGEIRASFARAGARTEAARVFETGGLRLRFPRASDECEAVLVNTGGGMAGGDRAQIDLALGPGARVIATTQAAEKIYRADGAHTETAVSLAVDSGASLVWAPQETLLFEGARLSRRLEADVASDASLVLLEATVFGRLAHGETQIDAAFHDDWRIRRGGRLIFAEAVRLQRAGATLDRPAVGRGARAIATLLFVGPGAPTRVGQLKAAFDAIVGDDVETWDAGVGVVEGALVARALSSSPARLRVLLATGMRVLLGREVPRVWR
jgi:urease accessory protein